MECPALYEAAEEGDRIRIDLEAGEIRLGEKMLTFPKMPESVRKILELGGLAEYLKTQLSGAGT
jgi:3-isopropylmalate dehydratase small subunit